MPVDSRRRKPDRDDDDEKRGSRDARQIVEAIRGTEKALVCRIAAAIEVLDAVLEALQRPPRAEGGHTNIHVVGVQLLPEEEIPMPPVDHMPDFTLPSTSVRAALAVVGPKKADGTYATSPTWSTSDETALPLEARPDSVVLGEDGNPQLDENGNQIPVYNTFANTPLVPEPGESAGGLVVWSAAGMADVDIKVIYGDPALGHAAITPGIAPEA